MPSPQRPAARSKPTPDDLRFAILAQDFFLGRTTARDSREIGIGVLLELAHRLQLEPRVKFAGDSFWDFVDTILNILKNFKPPDPTELARALAIAVYYFKNTPLPEDCKPRRVDRWQHCYVGCKINFWGGSLSNATAAILKEVADAFGLGEAEFADFVATLGGAWNCGFFESCEKCCCDKNF